MNRRSLFRALLGAPLAVPAIAAAAAKSAYANGGAVHPETLTIVGADATETVIPLKRMPRIDITVHAGDPDAFMLNLPQMKEQLRRAVKQAARSR